MRDQCRRIVPSQCISQRGAGSRHGSARPVMALRTWIPAQRRFAPGCPEGPRRRGLAALRGWLRIGLSTSPILLRCSATPGSVGVDEAIRRGDRSCGVARSRRGSWGASARRDRRREFEHAVLIAGLVFSLYLLLGSSEFARLVIVDNASTDGSRELLVALHRASGARARRRLVARSFECGAGISLRTIFGLCNSLHTNRIARDRVPGTSCPDA